MYSEANRRETFTSWPHVGYRWAQPDPMAQAGFYHQVKNIIKKPNFCFKKTFSKTYFVYPVCLCACLYVSFFSYTFDHNIDWLRLCHVLCMK